MALELRRGSRRFLLRISRPFFFLALRNATFTCFGKNDGGGAQVQAVASVAAFAAYAGARFVHTPLSHVAHCPPNLSQADFCRQWESIVELFGFKKSAGEEFTNYEGERGKYLFLRDVLSLRTRGRFICLPHAHFLTDHITGIYGLLSLSSTPVAKAKSQYLQIAVHVRRGDVGPFGQNSDRYTSNELIRHHIETVRREAGAACRVTIVTEDPDPEFTRMFKDCEIVVHDNPLEALEVLVNADILVMAKSSFSFVAGLLSTGRVYYTDFWSSPQPTWSVLPALSDERR